MMLYLTALALFLSPCVYAQQTVALPPQPAYAPIGESMGVPQQSVSGLLTLTAEPVLMDEELLDSAKDKEIKRLMKLPAFNLQTSKAPLNDVLSLLADSCQMSYVGLEKGLGEDVQISVNINKNPYEILKYLSARYGVSLDYEDGIWHFAIYNDNELIARVYHLRYNAQEEMDSGSSSSSSGSSSDSGSSSSSSSSDSSSTSSSSGTSSSGEEDSDEGFELNKDKLKENIEKFLEATSNAPDIIAADDFSVDSLTEITHRAVYRVRPTIKSGEGIAAATGTDSGKVLYNSDTKSLYVLATRAQHQLIERYLKSVDKPIQQILVETKVYETALTPEAALGFQWMGTMSVSGNGVYMQGGASQVATDTDGNYTPLGLQGLTAIIDGDDLDATVRFLNKDSNTVSVQYPRQVTVSNRLVTITSEETLPFQRSTTTTEDEGSDRTQTVADEAVVGTRISLLPRVIDGNKVHLNISVKVSSLIEYARVGENNIPRIGERTYKTEAIVENGYTLAIGGLKKSNSGETINSVPIVSKVPVIGNLFKQRSKSSADTNLLIFVSPKILNEYRGGVKDQPEFVLPNDKDYPVRRIFTGSADESYSDVMISLASIEREVQKIAQRLKERHGLETITTDIAKLENEVKLIRVRVREIAIEQPNKDVSQANELINKYLKDLNELSGNISKRKVLY